MYLLKRVAQILVKYIYYLPEVGYQEPRTGGDAHHGEVGGGWPGLHHVIHHHPRVLCVSHEVKLWRGQSHTTVTSSRIERCFNYPQSQYCEHLLNTQLLHPLLVASLV